MAVPDPVAHPDPALLLPPAPPNSPPDTSLSVLTLRDIIAHTLASNSVPSLPPIPETSENNDERPGR